MLTAKQLPTFPKSVVLPSSGSDCLTLKMEAAGSSGTSLFTNRQGRNATEYLNLHQHRCEHLKFHAQTILQRVAGCSLGHSFALNGLFNWECVFNSSCQKSYKSHPSTHIMPAVHKVVKLQPLNKFYSPLAEHILLLH